MAMVLIVATSHDRLGDTGHPTGVWLEELATPYYVLVDGGADATLASVKGGAIPVDPRSVLPPDSDAASVKRFLADPDAQKRSRNSPALAAVASEAFDVVFLPGGHGPMWDLLPNKTLAALIGNAYGSGRVVAAVCRGPVGLVSARRADGQPLVAGKRVTGFTNAEEEAVGLTEAVPFLLETRLRELGGRFENGPPFTAFAVHDGNLITGQNPKSSEPVAKYILEALQPHQAEAWRAMPFLRRAGPMAARTNGLATSGPRWRARAGGCGWPPPHGRLPAA
ncbi:type 1 glutamine amidotransferase domain-containing protein [Limobrevibacterium gyesilva]|uniref:Type 1 glutamine amidotransferase domain-containing protein n=1 Tax=Limobrevibacterium gyesilva TaxID=2991712 RepID=A0AA41YI15_9PROT|nr:type 1 glutamine amidotransferase domain-containing protein [Limobrevibacterium gyesilva]MCW3473274.1 type 1 glutamine amidotransferase domain-containing protein [Limobrevibacterium gyesilva]